MAKKPAEAKEAKEVTTEAPEGKKRRSIDFKANPFVVVTGSAKIMAAKPDVEAALAFVSNELPLAKRAKAFIGQFFPVEVEVKTEVKLKTGE
jgi:hypothetical protein